MKRGASGSRIETVAGGEKVSAFLPAPLPPTPPLVPELELSRQLDNAHLALGRLDHEKSGQIVAKASTRPTRM